MAVRERYWENRSAGAWHPGQPAEKLTPAGEAYFRTHGELPPDDTRADSTVTRDGLEMREYLDDSGRKIREFSSLTGRKNWMDVYKKTPHLMMRLNKDNQSPKQCARFEANWKANAERAAADLKAGRTPTCDLTVPMVEGE